MRRRDLLILFGLGLVINGLVAVAVNTPGYPDAYYYFNGAVLIAEGKGLVEPYLWNYVGAAPSLPVPAFGYWQPFPSMLGAVGIWLFGQKAAFGSAQAMYVIAAALLPVITYLVAEQIGERRHALIAGLLMVFSGFYVSFWSLPESFTPYALVGSGALALASSGRRNGRWWVWLLAGVCAGLAHLTRADGLLMIGIVGLVAVIPHLDSENGDISKRIIFVMAAVGGYLIAMGPWFARNMAAFGSFQAPGGLSTLWLRDYNELFGYPPNLTAERYFSMGWGAIIGQKWEAFKGNLGSFVAVQNLVFLTPFTLIGVWRRWRNDWVLPAVLYELALFGAMTFAFTLPGMRGGYFHSGGAVMPIMLAVSVLGIDDSIRWVIKRRRGWRFDDARKVFGASAVGLAMILTGYLTIGRVVGLSDLSVIGWNQADEVYAQIGESLDERGISRKVYVMTNNPPGFYTHTERGGIPIVDGDEETLLRAADQYGVEYLVLDSNVTEGLVSLYLDGPQSNRLEVVETFGSEDSPVYLYRILEKK